MTAFEEAVAELEGAEAALAFASGMGAVATVVMALCSSGDHIVAQRHIYAGTQLFLQGVCPRFGIEVTFVDATEPGALAAAVRPGRTMLVIAETPANPQLALTDLDELGAITGPFTVVDSTFATPIVQRPHDHGVDLVLHSATKGIAGHNDATLGVVAGDAELLDAIWAYSVLHGACASPFDAMNGLRGIRTLPVRIERQSATALALAEWFEGHPAVSCVRYPHLPSHPQHDLAKRQMAYGGQHPRGRPRRRSRRRPGLRRRGASGPHGGHAWAGRRRSSPARPTPPTSVSRTRSWPPPASAPGSSASPSGSSTPPISSPTSSGRWPAEPSSSQLRRGHGMSASSVATARDRFGTRNAIGASPPSMYTTRLELSESVRPSTRISSTGR